MINKYSLIFSNNLRSVEYLKTIIETNTKIEKFFFLESGKVKTKKKILDLIKKINIKKILRYKSKFVNNTIVNKIIKTKDLNFIVSLASGDIIKNKVLLKKKRLIHFHPGKLPDYRGATSIYYSLIKEKKIYCSCIILNDEIDGGNLIFTKKYTLPKNKKEIDNKYDDKIRKLSLKYLLSKRILTEIKQKKGKYHHYYIAHPVIRKIAFDSF